MKIIIVETDARFEERLLEKVLFPVPYERSASFVGRNRTCMMNDIRPIRNQRKIWYMYNCTWYMVHGIIYIGPKTAVKGGLTQEEAYERTY